MTWKGRSADVRDLLVFLSLKKKNSSMSKGRRVRRSHLAWLRGENEIAWFSFAAKHTVSFSANVNKDRKRWDHRGPPAPPAAAGSFSILESLPGFVWIIALEKDSFQPCWVTKLSCIRENLFLGAQGSA